MTYTVKDELDRLRKRRSRWQMNQMDVDKLNTGLVLPCYQMPDN